MKRFLSLFLFAGLAVAAPGPQLRAQATRGVPFPSLADAGLTGGSLPDLAGKVVLIDFCASWCAPCRASFPAYTRLEKEFGPRGLVILGISIDKDPAAFAAMVKKLRPGFAILNDSTQKLVSEVQVPGMPTSYLLDRSGHIAAIRIGFHSGQTEDELRANIERLLAQPQ